MDYVDPNTGEVYELLPREEVLARLYELVAVYERRRGHRSCPVAAEKGLPPHIFRFGCCARVSGLHALADEPELELDTTQAGSRGRGGLSGPRGDVSA